MSIGIHHSWLEQRTITTTPPSKPKLKGIFSDSNNIVLWHESKHINKKAYFQYFIDFVDLQFLGFQAMHDYVCFIICFRRLMC